MLSDKNKKNIKIGFWGGPDLSVIVLNRLRDSGFVIAFVVTTPDKPKGRHLILAPTPAKVWAQEHDVPLFQPVTLNNPNFEKTLRDFDCDIFIVMAYGKIIPESILNIPKRKTLNIHPSLLPKFRGASPIESAILADEKVTGVTIMRLDAGMDHGPIIIQKEYAFEPWPPSAEELGNELADLGSDLLIFILPHWISGELQEKEQDHSEATFTKKIKKEDGLIDLAGDPYKNFLKIQAYSDWPSAYFFKGSTRVKITKASFKNGNLIIEKVIPEGKKEMNYTDFIR